MKKLTVIAAVALMTLPCRSENDSMVFRTSDGAVHTLNAQGLDITFAEGNMTAANQAQTITLPLASLTSMEFGPGSSSLAESLSEITGQVTVYSVNGVETGTFPTIASAISDLPEGIFIVKYAEDKTLKIIVRK